MNDLDLFYKYCQKVGNYHATDAVERWKTLDQDTKSSIIEMLQEEEDEY